MVDNFRASSLPFASQVALWFFILDLGWIYLVSFIFATYRWRLSPVFGILRLVLNLVNAGWPIARLLAALFRSLYDPLAQYGAPAVKPKRETRLQSLTDLFPVRRQHSRNQWMWWNQRQSFSQLTNYVKYTLKPSQKVFLCQFYGAERPYQAFTNWRQSLKHGFDPLTLFWTM